MQNATAANQFQRNIAFFQHLIRTMIPGKGKLPLSIWLDIDKCQCCEVIITQRKPGTVNSALFQRLLEESAVHIISGFADKCRSCPQLCHSSHDIGRSTAGILRKNTLSLLISALHGEVDQHFSQCTRQKCGFLNHRSLRTQDSQMFQFLQKRRADARVIGIYLQNAGVFFRQPQHAQNGFCIYHETAGL